MTEERKYLLSEYEIKIHYFEVDGKPASNVAIFNRENGDVVQKIDGKCTIHGNQIFVGEAYIVDEYEEPTPQYHVKVVKLITYPKAIFKIDFTTDKDGNKTQIQGVFYKETNEFYASALGAQVYIDDVNIIFEYFIKDEQVFKK